MRIAYADPPYPGQAKLYRDHPDYAGEVDHAQLLERLRNEFDGWILHTASTTVGEVLPHVGEARMMAWVKPFAAFKRNIPIAYAWEPVFVQAARKPVVCPRLREDHGIVSRDWIAERITLQKGLAGAKPERVCWWLFHCVGADPEDELVDLFPGTGAVSRAWETWCAWRAEGQGVR